MLSRVGDLNVIRRQPLEPGHSSGQVAVLVHGAMDRATSFTRLMNRLPDWEIVAYDRRGYAGSSRTGPPSSFDQQVEDLAAVLDFAAVDGRLAIAFGHSLGGDVVLAALAAGAGSRAPSLQAAVVWEPPQPWLPWWPDMPVAQGSPGVEVSSEDRAEQFMRRMVGNDVWERLPPATREQRRAEGPTLDADMRFVRRGPLFDATHIPVPVIVGIGEHALPFQRQGAVELVAALPRGEIAEIAGAGHGAHLSHPAEVAALIRRVAELVERPAA